MYISDLSKVFMYQFHYDYIKNIKNKYGNNSRLLFTDTGSLMHEIKTEDGSEGFSMDACLVSIIIQLSQNVMMIQTISSW